MGAALSHADDAGRHPDPLHTPPPLPGAEKSRKELFEERLRPPTRVYPYISLREDEQDHHPVASTSKAAFHAPVDVCSYRTLDDFRRQDRDRKGRLRKLFNTLRQEWALPHDHTAYTTHTRHSSHPESELEEAPRQLTADEKRVEVINKEYLSELYHSLCPGDEAAKGKGPSFERFTQFVEAKEQGKCDASPLRMFEAPVEDSPSLSVALWELFCNIDKDKDMQLTAEELQNALHRAGEP